MFQTISDLLTIEGLSKLEAFLLYCGVGVMIYLAYLQVRHIRRRRRYRRHQARKRARENAQAAMRTEGH